MKTKSYKLKFFGQVKIEATSEDEAKLQLENMKNITTDGPVKIYNYSMLLAKGIAVNIGAIVTMFLAIGLIVAWKQMLDYTQTLPQGLNIIGLFLSIIVVLNTVRIPQTIGNYLLFKEW